MSNFLYVTDTHSVIAQVLSLASPREKTLSNNVELYYHKYKVN